MRMSEALRRTGSAARATAGAVRGGTRRTGGLVHRVTGAQGAGRTGLSTLIELTAAAGAGDAFVIVSLAGTIFFNTSVEQARGKVVLFLVVTMAPFAVLAPFIGPALDRVQQGRKYLLAGTLLARGLLCYAMSAAVSNPITLLPAAFGILVLQKAYGVVRASVAPRLLPEQITLVSANARSQLIAVITATLAAGLAEGIQVVGGAAWVLRVGMVVYLAAMVPALRLPQAHDFYYGGAWQKGIGGLRASIENPGSGEVLAQIAERLVEPRDAARARPLLDLVRQRDAELGEVAHEAQR